MKNIQYRFQGRNIIITGGAQGIGLGVAKAFLESGANVSIWDYSEQALQSVRAELAHYGERVHTCQVDVSRPESCQAAAQNLPFKVDVLLNNAGITRDKSFAKMSNEEWQAVIDTNLSGLFYVTKSLFDHFAEHSHKRIINISSIVALYGNYGQTNYVAAKSGVIGMTKTWSRELTGKGFTVNAIAPGFVRTAMVAKMPPEVVKAMTDKISVKRIGESSDIANAVMFLASEDAGYITGTILSVDGGLVL